MPRPAQGAHLYLRTRKAADGSTYKVWVIRDGSVFRGTGCGEGEFKAAEGQLGEYIAKKHKVCREERDLADIPVADVLTIYADDKVPHIVTSHKALARIGRLMEWWGQKSLAQVKGKLCRKFAEERGHGAARRELQDLQAAINYHHAEGYHREIVKVTLPPAGLARERWLTRQEAAKLLRICLHHAERQGDESTLKRPLRHIARFIIFALYTGSRPGDCLNASFRVSSGSGYVDTGTGLYFRRPSGKRATKKRQPTIPLRGSILAHCTRWARCDGKSVVEFDGVPIRSIKTAWHRLIELAGPGFEDVVPYTCRHTAITWMLQRGVDIWEVAGYVGTSPAMIERHYGHHCPDHLKGAAGAISRRVG